MSVQKLLFKLIVVGDGGVGKSTMIQRLTTGHFIPQKITIGTDLATIDIDISPKVIVKLQIWDFAGERRFRFFLPNYSRGALGVILCFDMTRFVSFENLDEWYEVVSKNAPEAIFALVGGKLDLAAEGKRVVNTEDAEEFQKYHNIPYYFETSSKSGENNRKIFETITRAIIDMKNIPI